MTNAETLNQFVTLVASGNLEPALAFIHPECVVHEADSLPYPGEFHGPQGFADLIAQVFAGSEMSVEETELIDARDVIIARMNTSWTSRATGKSTPMAITEIYRFTDGLISYVDVFYKDTKAITDMHSAALTSERLP